MALAAKAAQRVGHAKKAAAAYGIRRRSGVAKRRNGEKWRQSQSKVKSDKRLFSPVVNAKWRQMLCRNGKYRCHDDLIK